MIISSFSLVAQGLLAGIAFGFFLQKGRVSQFNVIVGQMLLRDFTVMKIMLTAMLVGGIGFYALLHGQIIPGFLCQAIPHYGILIGGLIFGVGMTTLGYCPGTCVAAAGQGSKDAYFGILGMIAGSLCYVYTSHWFTPLQNKALTTSRTLAQLFGLSPWIILAFLAGATVLIFSLTKNK